MKELSRCELQRRHMWLIECVCAHVFVQNMASRVSDMDMEEGYGAVSAVNKSTGKPLLAFFIDCGSVTMSISFLRSVYSQWARDPTFRFVLTWSLPGSKLGRFMRFSAMLAVAAVVVVALAGMSAGDDKPAQLSETWEYANADKRTMSMLLQKLQEEAPAEGEGEAPAEDEAEAPAEEGGEEAAPMHHIKNFAGTEQMMNTGEVAAQGAGADFQEGEVVGAGVHVMTGIGSGDGVSVRTGVINGQGVTAGSGEGMGTGMFAGKGDGTGMMVSVGSGVGSGHMITVGDGFVEGKVR